MVFIVVDGTDGSGKATQSDTLKSRLIEAGKEVVFFDFPQYGQPSAALIEDYLNGVFGTAQEVSPKAASILYAIDRFAAKKKMQEAISADKVVLCNRYVSSNQGHQAGKIADPVERDAFLAWLDELEYGIFGIPRPDLTIFLDVPPAIGQALVDRKGERSYTKGRDIHERDLSHLENAYLAYQELCRRKDWARIACVEEGVLLDKEKIADKVWDIVKQRI